MFYLPMHCNLLTSIHFVRRALLNDNLQYRDNNGIY